MAEPIMLLAAIATIGGVLIAPASLIIKRFKNDDPLEAEKRRSRAKPAEIFITLTSKIQKAMCHIRDPYFENAQIEDALQACFRYTETAKRIQKYEKLFENLREEQIRIKTIIGDKPTDRAIETLLEIYDNLKTDIENLVFRAQSSENNFERERDLEKKIYKNDGETDKVSKAIKKAIKKIETRLTPIARMEIPPEQKKKKRKKKRTKK